MQTKTKKLRFSIFIFLLLSCNSNNDNVVIESNFIVQNESSTTTLPIVVSETTTTSTSTTTTTTLPIISNLIDAQKKLQELNLYDGEIDGINGVGTKAAIREFQRLSGLTVDGILGPITKKALSKGSNLSLIHI